MRWKYFDLSWWKRGYIDEILCFCIIINIDQDWMVEWCVRRVTWCSTKLFSDTVWCRSSGLFVRGRKTPLHCCFINYLCQHLSIALNCTALTGEISNGNLVLDITFFVSDSLQKGDKGSISFDHFQNSALGCQVSTSIRWFFEIYYKLSETFIMMIKKYDPVLYVPGILKWRNNFR